MVKTRVKPFRGEDVATASMTEKGVQPPYQLLKRCRNIFYTAVKDIEKVLEQEGKPGTTAYILGQKRDNKDLVTRGFFSVKEDRNHTIALMPGLKHQRWEEKLRKTASHEYSHSIYFRKAEEHEEIYRKLLGSPDNMEKILAEGYAIQSSEKVGQAQGYQTEIRYSEFDEKPELEQVEKLLEPGKNTMFREKEMEEFDYTLANQLFKKLTEKYSPYEIPVLERTEARKGLLSAAEELYSSEKFMPYTDFSRYSM